MAEAVPSALLAREALTTGGNVCQQVQLPAEELVENQCQELVSRDVLHGVGQDAPGGSGLLVVTLRVVDGGYKHHVLFHVARELMVAPVR